MNKEKGTPNDFCYNCQQHPSREGSIFCSMECEIDCVNTLHADGQTGGNKREIEEEAAWEDSRLRAVEESEHE